MDLRPAAHKKSGRNRVLSLQNNIEQDENQNKTLDAQSVSLSNIRRNPKRTRNELEDENYNMACYFISKFQTE